MNRPLIYLHNASLARIGEFTSVEKVARSYSIDPRPQACTFVVSEDDPMLAESDPSLGRAVAVVSPLYPVPWVGKITAVRQVRESPGVTVTCASWERILAQRFLGNEANFKKSVPIVFQEILSALNAGNGTGIVAGSVTAGRPDVFDASLPFESGDRALSKAAAFGHAEWWLEYEVRSTGIRITANLAEYRGADQSGAAFLQDGGNASWVEWLLDGEAASFAATVVGGQQTPVQYFTDQASARATRQQQRRVYVPHGYLGDDGIKVESPMNRIESLQRADYLRGTDLVRLAANVAVGQGGADRLRKLRIAVHRDPVWKFLVPGNVVRIDMPGTFLSPAGFRGPARVRVVQPSEEADRLDLTVELMASKNAPAGAQL